MLFALGAVSSIWDGLQALTASGSSSSLTSTHQSQAAVNPFDPGCGTQCRAAAGPCGGTGGCSQISPETLSALIHAQSQSGTTNTAPINPQDALRDLFSKIDVNGDGSITRSEFENSLGAGGTNLAAADDVFGKLDSNSDGSVSLDELKNALQGAAGHHHLHAQSDPSKDSGTDLNSDPLTQALAGACRNAVTNSAMVPPRPRSLTPTGRRWS
jgi:EF-hand domain pair